MARVGRKSDNHGDNGRDILGSEERRVDRYDLIAAAAEKINAAKRMAESLFLPGDIDDERYD